MEHRPAERLSEIVRSWEIVHDAYLELGILRHAAPAGLFLHHEAIDGRGCVAVALDGGQMVATAGAILDSPAGLPLDRQFPAGLAALRIRHRLIEIGSLASEARDAAAALGCIAVLLEWGRSVSATAVVLGCHPHHLRFYRVAYGVRQLGEKREYDGLAAPVVLGVVTYEEMLRLHRDRRGVRHWQNHPADLSRMMEPARLREVV